MRLALSAGEASGDAYGAALIRELSALGFDGRIQAMGGERIKQAGAEVVADSRTWGSIGMYEAVKSVPKAAGGYLAMRTCLTGGDPGVFVPIDFGWANIRLSRVARQRGWKVVYFIPPGSWKKKMSAGDLPQVTDAVICPFPWNVDVLTAAGVDARFFGHPLKSLLAEQLESGAKRSGIAVLPGSRQQEVHANLPEIAKAIAGKDLPVNIGVASSVDRTSLAAKWESLSSARTQYYESAAEALVRSELAVVCSGTATLEAALCRCPCVVVYKGSKLLQLEAKLSGRGLRFVSLPNLILNRAAVPELLIDEARADRIREEIDTLLKDPEAAENQVSAFREIEGLLGPAEAIPMAAKFIYDFIA